jgi:hypothetical protein
VKNSTFGQPWQLEHASSGRPCFIKVQNSGCQQLPDAPECMHDATHKLRPTCSDVAPLVRPSHLYLHTLFPTQVDKVVALHTTRSGAVGSNQQTHALEDSTQPHMYAALDDCGITSRALDGHTKWHPRVEFPECLADSAVSLLVPIPQTWTAEFTYSSWYANSVKFAPAAAGTKTL